MAQVLGQTLRQSPKPKTVQAKPTTGEASESSSGDEGESSSDKGESMDEGKNVINSSEEY
jgi:hypothetical protein